MVNDLLAELQAMKNECSKHNENCDDCQYQQICDAIHETTRVAFELLPVAPCEWKLPNKILT